MLRLPQSRSFDHDWRKYSYLLYGVKKAFREPSSARRRQQCWCCYTVISNILCRKASSSSSGCGPTVPKVWSLLKTTLRPFGQLRRCFDLLMKNTSADWLLPSLFSRETWGFERQRLCFLKVINTHVSTKRCSLAQCGTGQNSTPDPVCVFTTRCVGWMVNIIVEVIMILETCPGCVGWTGIDSSTPVTLSRSKQRSQLTDLILLHTAVFLRKCG